MSLADFQDYLRTQYVSPTTGRPLGEGAASDYPSRLRTLTRLIGVGIESATEAELLRIAEELTTGRNLPGLDGKTRSDFGVALRSYAAFLGTPRPDPSPPGRRAEVTGPTSNRVYIANFGRGNSLWPQCLAHSTLATYDDAVVHDFWLAGDREGYIAACIAHTKTALGEPPTRPTAGRWFNLIGELQDSENDIWISRQGDAIWWSKSLPGGLNSTLQALAPGAQPVWVLEKPCTPWRDKDAAGRPLRWSALHPKSKDFLATEATFQTLSNDRGYADYARALVAGDSLEPWHSSALFASRSAESRRGGGRIFSPKELAAARMTRTLLATVAGANGQIVERQVKEKTTNLSQLEWEELLRTLMGEQEDRCALTGLPLGYDKDCEDSELLVSLDRIDSSGHYTPDNVQLVCRFINRWKGADNDQLTRRLIGLVQQR